MTTLVYDTRADRWMPEAAGEESHPDGWENHFPVEFVETERGLEARIEDGGGEPLFTITYREAELPGELTGVVRALISTHLSLDG